jgi:hypothetical protein
VVNDSALSSRVHSWLFDEERWDDLMRADPIFRLQYGMSYGDSLDNYLHPDSREVAVEPSRLRARVETLVWSQERVREFTRSHDSVYPFGPLYEEYPGAAGFVRFRTILYAPDSSAAAVYIEHGCAPHCGCLFGLLARRTERGWIGEYAECLSIS